MAKITNTSKDPRLDWLFGINPEAIYNQESEGQKELNSSDQLPRKCNSPRGIDIKEQYKLMGINVLSDSEGDELFLDVIMPKGWRKEATDHSMWNNLVDDKGIVRGTIFYKAAFYDRDSFMNFKTRYERSCKYYDREYTYCVIDNSNNEVLFETDRLNSHVMGDDYFKRQDSYIAQCDAFLDNNYPQHKDINAYWS